MMEEQEGIGGDNGRGFFTEISEAESYFAYGATLVRLLAQVLYSFYFISFYKIVVHKINLVNFYFVIIWQFMFLKIE